VEQESNLVSLLSTVLKETLSIILSADTEVL
jgi:hypothetical protein